MLVAVFVSFALAVIRKQHNLEEAPPVVGMMSVSGSGLAVLGHDKGVQRWGLR
jgi:hypothetical protein